MPVDGRLTALLGQAGLSPAGNVTPLPGAANNRLFVVETDVGPVVLKSYFHHPDDPRDRLGAEFGFSEFAWAHGVRAIPRPLAANKAEHLALYDYVEGVRPEAVNAAAVKQAMAFLAELDAQRAHGLGLPSASEACFSLTAHLACVSGRVAALACVEHQQARQFVREALAPAWELIHTRVVETAVSLDISLDQPQAVADRCISPSDFGFHNALRDGRGHYWFLDFEYAGWDDPAKLVCDFFCQQTRPVPHAYFDTVVNAVMSRTSDPAMQARRVQLLWPMYQLKWACILLNEFLPVSRRRRRFAGAGHQLQRQIERSRDLLDRAVRDASRLHEAVLS